MFIKKTFKVAADMKELETVTSCVRKILDEIEAPSGDSMKVEVIVEEIFSNIALYAYKDIKPDVSKSVEDKGGLAGLIEKFKSGPVSPYAKITVTVPDDKGSITGLYAVLVDGDDFNEPITDTARSILDGHIMLSRKLAHKNHYPAIDVLQSISRCMSMVASKEHRAAAGKLKNVLATYNEAEDLINIGAYKKGSNPDIDFAISKIKAVNDFLMQDVDDKFTLEESLKLLNELFA